jgi:energy-coupling factor transport system substrate-specific component
MKLKTIWKFSSQEIIYGSIGAALYGIFSWITNLIQFPITGNDLFKPGIIIPLFFGIAFGPWVGLISGLFGSILSDLLSGFSFWIIQNIGYGIMGIVTGLGSAMMIDYRRKKDIIIAEIFAVIGVAIGLLFISVTEIWISEMNLALSLKINFYRAFLTNGLTGIILMPFVMKAYCKIEKRLIENQKIEKNIF